MVTWGKERLEEKGRLCFCPTEDDDEWDEEEGKSGGCSWCHPLGHNDTDHQSEPIRESSVGLWRIALTKGGGCSWSIFDHRTAAVEIKPQKLSPNKLTKQPEAIKLNMWVHRVERFHPTKPCWCSILYYASSVHKGFEWGIKHVSYAFKMSCWRSSGKATGT